MIFTDATGRVWSGRVDWGAMRRSREAGVDLSTIEELLGDFYRGSDKLITALWAVMEPTARAEQCSREVFEGAVTGDVIAVARDALIDSVAAFFPSDRRAIITVTNHDVSQEFAALVSKSQKQSSGSPESAEESTQSV